MAFKHKEAVEIRKKQEGLSGIYYNAILLAASCNREETNTWYVMILVSPRTDQGSSLKLLSRMKSGLCPPQISYTNFVVSDRVDAYVNFAWRVGIVTSKVDPNYYVKLDCNGHEEHCAFYKVRLHLEWQNGSWFYPGCRSQSNQANTSAQGVQPANDGNQANTEDQGTSLKMR